MQNLKVVHMYCRICCTISHIASVCTIFENIVTKLTCFLAVHCTKLESHHQLAHCSFHDIIIFHRLYNNEDYRDFDIWSQFGLKSRIFVSVCRDTRPWCKILLLYSLVTKESLQGPLITRSPFTGNCS